MNGIIVINKETGFTSNDVVAKMRGILKERHIGHTGTLDPQATGVLPVCIGNATKLFDMFADRDKEYEAGLLLGKTTDTEDIWGETLSESAVNVDEDEIREAVMGFVGEYMQTPPMYSALKVNGKKLYELARAGVEVERKPRKVNINAIRINSVDLPHVSMNVECTKGTYIRTLCADIGDKLGCGGCMESLKRVRVGNFYLKDAITLSELEKIRDAGEVQKILIPVEKFFEDRAVITAKEDFDKAVNNGNILYPENTLEGTICP
ncbi:MAG: tRNA pseudouridine(55) synthase TruB, partial [Lachnospiraceae bacterium]|nr:tRNA pseudouridine(55) synthase TruB [Lachnospiraceae bacterium]